MTQLSIYNYNVGLKTIKLLLGDPEEGGGSGVLPREEAPAHARHRRGDEGRGRLGADAATARGLGWGRGEEADKERGGGPVGVRGGLRAASWDSARPFSREPIQ